VRISSHNFGKNIYHYQTAPETILSCRARGRGEKTKEQDKDSCCTQRWEKSGKSLEPTYLRPSPVSRNLSRDDNDDDAKSLLAHRQRPTLALAKAGFAKKISEVSAANRLLSSTGHSAPPRSLARSLYCVVPNPPHTCTPHNKPLCPSHSASHSILFILRFDRCCNPLAASCKDIAIRHRRRRGSNIAKHIGIRHRRKPYRGKPSSSCPFSLSRLRRPTQRGVDFGGLFSCFFPPSHRERETEREKDREILNAWLVIAADC
jgi:hypothetical protein